MATVVGGAQHASYEDWTRAVGTVLTRSGRLAGHAAGAVDGRDELEPADRVLAELSTTVDGLTVAPLYTAATAPPGRRSPVVARPSWDVRGHYAGSDSGELATLIADDVANGVTSLWLDRELSEHALIAALGAVPLDTTPIALGRAAGVGTAGRLVDLADRQGASLRGTLGADPIGRAGPTGRLADPKSVLPYAELTRDRPGLAAITVDGSSHHDRGAGDVDELAITASAAVAYVRVLVDDGWTVEQAMARIDFRYAVTDDQFVAMAKLRAARRLWARIGELSGAGTVRQFQHAVTSAPMMTTRDRPVNILRTTVAAIAAAMGGADAITVAPFADPASALARRLARNTQAVLHDEASLARVDDPGGGSYYVEALSESMAQAAWARFTALERAGGAANVAAVAALSQTTAARRRDDVAHRRQLITGVSAFPRLDEPATASGSTEHGAAPAEHGAAPTEHGAAPTEHGAAPTEQVDRYSAAFEALRDRADAHLDRTAQRPTVGLVDGTNRLEGWVRELFAVGGVEVVVGPQASDCAVTVGAGAGGPRSWVLLDAPASRADAGHVLYPGVDAVAVLDATLTWLGA